MFSYYCRGRIPKMMKGRRILNPFFFVKLVASSKVELINTIRKIIAIWINVV